MWGLAAVLLLVAVARGAVVKVEFGERGVEVDSASPAVTLDFWLRNDTRYGEKWGNTSALLLDLDDPALLELASGLAPSLLRLGGSPEDSIVYDMKGGCVPGGDGPGGQYYCSQVRPYTYGCLSRFRWAALLRFAQRTGLRLVLGLNACYGRKSANTSMDFTNIRELLEYTKTLDSELVEALYGFELGNEVTHSMDPSATSGIMPSQWAQDVATLRKLVDEVLPGKRVKLAGPDDYSLQGYQVIVQSMTQQTLNALTYHQYPQCEHSESSQFVLEPSCLQKLDTTASQLADLVRDKFDLWAGETADHSGGGVKGVTDTFESSFYYAWQLGALPQHRVKLVARQCFTGGDYELVSRFTQTPHPDYYVAWMFRYMGVRNITVRLVHVTPPVETTGARVFAFDDAQGGRFVVVVNLSMNQTHTVDLPVANAGTTQREWHFTSDAVTSNRLFINGQRMDFSGKLPSIDSLARSAPQGPLTVAPASIVFAHRSI
eukprot:Sspe_Gene.108048::Locus_87209_Transcript_1_1_Confidence_1.000_Length_1571::g.108048::m.108048/K07964/HPSE; heparanase